MGDPGLRSIEQVSKCQPAPAIISIAQGKSAESHHKCNAESTLNDKP